MTKSAQSSPWTGGRRLAAAIGLAAWFAAAAVIGTQGLLANDGRFPIPPIALSAALPVALFIAAYALSDRFRAFVLAQDIRTLTMMQHWRVIGFCFLPLYAFGVLPGLFAFPAGLGDVAIGLAALAVVGRLDRETGALTSPGLVRFHLLGLLDFALAIGTAALASGAFPALAGGGPVSAPMDVWPLNIFPSFGVPLFIIAHLTVLLKVRHLRRAAVSPTSGVFHAA